jgi:hypothetical protein
MKHLAVFGPTVINRGVLIESGDLKVIAEEMLK